MVVLEDEIPKWRYVMAIRQPISKDTTFYPKFTAYANHKYRSTLKN